LGSVHGMANMGMKVAIAASTPFLILVATWPGQAATAAEVVTDGTATAAFLAQASPQQAEFQRQQAALLYNQGNLTAAATLLESALDIYLDGEDPNQIQQTASFLGVVYGELGARSVAAGDLTAALDYYQQQIEAVFSGFNRAAQAQALINAGQVALQIEGLEESQMAQEYLTAGLEIAQEVNNPLLIQQAQSLLD
jgi:tetratricopeptide (TPR) repeat protein